MPPIEQEQRCTEAVCSYLTEQSDHVWRVQKWLDDETHDTRSPDVLLGNGIEDMMVEISRLTDGPTFHSYDNDLRSLYQGLAPDRVGRYSLFLPPPHILRLERAQIRSLKRSIARVHNDLPIGGKATVAIPRQGTVNFLRDSDIGCVRCKHVEDSALHPVSHLLKGRYYLKDDFRYHHQFLSEDRRLEFHRRLAGACKRSQQEGSVSIQWEEQWELQRHEDSSENNGGVLVVGYATGRLESAAIKSVARALSHGKMKLHAGRGSTKVAVALHAGESQHMLALKHYEDAIAGLAAKDVHPLDLVFLVRGDRVHRCFAYGYPGTELEEPAAVEPSAAQVDHEEGGA